MANITIINNTHNQNVPELMSCAQTYEENWWWDNGDSNDTDMMMIVLMIVMMIW